MCRLLFILAGRYFPPHISVISRVLVTIVPLLLILAAWTAMLRQRDMWPFSCYPMFSIFPGPNKLVVYRVCFRRDDGVLQFWHPHFYKLQPQACADLVRYAQGSRPEDHAWQHIAFQTIRSCMKEDPQTTNLKSFYIVRRRCELDSRRHWRIIDDVIGELTLWEDEERVE